MKAILVIADGMADRPLKELKWKTPLEVANKPALNEIAEKGICGILDPIAPGIPVGSDVATLALLGYDAQQVYVGRGALEALGAGVEVLPGDVAFRCNFATVNENLEIIDRRAGRIPTEEASKLAAGISHIVLEEHPEVEITFINTINHRGVLRLRGPDLSSMVTDSDPLHVGMPVQKIYPLNNSMEAEKTARIANELAEKFHQTLKSHPINIQRREKGLPPANIVIFRGAGQLPDIPPLILQYGIKPAAIAAMSLVRGVAKAAGMRLINVPEATGTVETNIEAKANAAAQTLQTHDFVLLHFKATDVAAHDGNIRQKIQMIEKFDLMLSHLLDAVDINETIIAVTADHTTSSVTKEHEGDPVPVAIAGREVRVDDVKEFTERACAKGGLGRIRGKHLMPIMMNLIGKLKKFGT
jgi:2,3-bisphosphoglycerate-independent phosphoglycerate mutase